MIIIPCLVVSLLAGPLASNEVIIEYPSVHYQAMQKNWIDVDSEQELITVDNS